jgi:hypothetical protein
MTFAQLPHCCGRNQTGIATGIAEAERESCFHNRQHAMGSAMLQPGPSSKMDMKSCCMRARRPGATGLSDLAPQSVLENTRIDGRLCLDVLDDGFFVLAKGAFPIPPSRHQ